MRTLIKVLVIIGLTVILMPLIVAAREVHWSWLSIPLSVGYCMAVIGVWNWKPEKQDKKFEIDKH